LLISDTAVVAQRYMKALSCGLSGRCRNNRTTGSGSPLASITPSLDDAHYDPRILCCEVDGVPASLSQNAQPNGAAHPKLVEWSTVSVIDRVVT
jgi:hypothetical protein